VLRAAGGPHDAVSVGFYRDVQLAAWRAATIVPADVMPVLRCLRAAGVRLGLGSNCSRLTRVLLPGWPFPGHFDAIVLSCEGGVAKPNPEIFRIAIEALGADSGDVLVVDDNAEFIAAAHASGMRGLTIARAPERAAAMLA